MHFFKLFLTELSPDLLHGGGQLASGRLIKGGDTLVVIRGYLHLTVVDRKGMTPVHFNGLRIFIDRRLQRLATAGHLYAVAVGHLHDPGVSLGR